MRQFKTPQPVVHPASKGDALIPRNAVARVVQRSGALFGQSLDLIGFRHALPPNRIIKPIFGFNKRLILGIGHQIFSDVERLYAKMLDVHDSGFIVRRVRMPNPRDPDFATWRYRKPRDIWRTPFHADTGTRITELLKPFPDLQALLVRRLMVFKFLHECHWRLFHSLFPTSLYFDTHKYR